MDAIKNLTERRSIRSYSDRPIEKEVLAEILRVGSYAPTGMNKQSPIMIAITNKELRDRLAKLNAQVMGSDRDPFYGAPVVVVVLADKNVRTYVYDGSLVMGNLMNAAHALGVGSCWIHRAKEVFDSPEGKEILKELGIEGEYEGIGNCILGYTEGEYPMARARKENYIYIIE